MYSSTENEENAAYITEQYGINFIRPLDETWHQFRCLNPDHEDVHPSASLNLETGHWNCFSCGDKGNLLRNMDSDLSEADMIARSYSRLNKTIKGLLSESETPHQRNVIKPTLDVGNIYDAGPLSYLRKRGFSQQLLLDWGIKYAHSVTLNGARGKIRIRHRIAIPMNDAGGYQLGWCYRATPRTSSDIPKYIYSPGLPMNDILFGLDRCINLPINYGKTQAVVAVEGPLDALWLWQHGIPAVGLGGTNHLEKLGLLSKMKRSTELIVMMDRDKAGQAAAEKIVDLFYDELPVSVARYPRSSTATDPQELNEKELRRMVDRSLFWFHWKLRNDALALC